MKIAVIPARGGSKRIPRKNIRPFGGKPMITYSIAAAMASEVFDRVLVSTDDDEIAKVALAHGAQVPFKRPASLSDDYTGTTDVMAHAISALQEQGCAPSQVCCIYATAPFVSAQDIREAGALMASGRWAYVFSATTYAYPVFRSLQRQPDGSLGMLFPEHFQTRSQDLPELFHDAGQFYWGQAQAWTTLARIFDARSTMFHVPRWRVQDIDTDDDWIRAEAMASYLLKA